MLGLLGFNLKKSLYICKVCFVVLEVECSLKWEKVGTQ
jgi:hypothetical protein